MAVRNFPTRFTTIFPEVNQVKKWDRFWKTLYKEEWLKGNGFIVIHLFNFGSNVPSFDSKNEHDIRKCHLCLQEVNSNAIQNHLYNMCESTKYWWHEVKFTEPMHLKEMLAPRNTSFESLRNLNWFVKTVKKNYSLRRRESPKGDTLLPLRKKQMKKALGETKPMGR
ncbi:hypothetical protein JCM33374_g953 [Metschnikowia sp. JCM 33374]|nr:hypothetical protein JCM33374_g953 [Metschnikowia sp. JCM 33374]